MRVSMVDVARAANVSQAAVSRVISGNGYVSDGKRQRILAAIKRLGYVPNALARSLASSKSGTIGLCLPYLNTPFIPSVMEGVEEAAERHNYDVFMYHTREDAVREAKAIARMIERQVEGMLIIPVLGGRHALLDAIHLVPTMILLRQPEGLDRNLICASDYAATQRSYEYLLDNGHRAIGIIQGPMTASTIRERWRGIQDLYRKRRLDMTATVVVQAGFSYQESYAVAHDLLERNGALTAVYPMHYWASAAVQRVAFEKHLRIPEDISVVAYESFEDWSYMANLRIATNIFPALEMGRVAVDSLHRLITTRQLFLEDNIVVPPEFLPFDSVKRLPGAAAPTGRHRG
ncbi:MAG: LacI family transcriptional regulator [Planctomycetes bacterium]|nr:LacI family transcriptional regulator [Planctomycetota bacterium]